MGTNDSEEKSPGPGSAWVRFWRAYWPELSLLGLFLLAQIPVQQALFVDEPDNMLGGWLIVNGEVLYRDFFSHHAPFPYFYSAFFSLLSGKHFVVQRLSMSLFGFAALATIVHRIRYDRDGLFRATMLLFIGLWIVYARIYWHFMVLADNFAGYGLLVLFIILAHALWTRLPLSRIDQVALGLFGFASLGSNPHAIFPIVICVAFYLWIVFREETTDWLGMALGVGSFLAPTILLVGYFTWHGSLLLVKEQVIGFNSQTYSQYLPDATNFLGTIFRSTYTLFGLMDITQWDFRLKLDEPFKNWADDRWAYLGMVGRLSLLGVVGYAIATRKVLLALMLFAVGACSLSRDLSFVVPDEIPAFFHIQHFRALGLFSMCLLMILSGRLLLQAKANQSKAIPGLILLALILVNAMVICRSALTVADNGLRIAVQPNAKIERWDPFLNWQVDVCTELVGKEGKVSSFPSGMYVLYLGRFDRASHFLFYLPWTAHRPQDRQQLLADLDRGARQSTAFWIHRQGHVWQHRVEDFAVQPLQYLDDNYIRVSPDIYVSEKSRVVRMITAAQQAGVVVREPIVPTAVMSGEQPLTLPLGPEVIAVEISCSVTSDRLVEKLSVRCLGANGSTHQVFHVGRGERRRWLLWLPLGVESIEISGEDDQGSVTLEDCQALVCVDPFPQDSREEQQWNRLCDLLPTLWPPSSE